jgi:hypothetical protein
MAAFAENRRLYSLEMMQFVGGRHVTLSSEVAKYRGSCELWRAKPGTSYNGTAATHQMLWLMGQHYGWCDFFRIAVRVLFPRVVLPSAVDNDDPDDPRVCSGAVAWAIRTGGGVDVCPTLPDDDTSPADIAQCGAFEYVCTPVL